MQQRQTTKRCRHARSLCKHLKNITKPPEIESKAVPTCDTNTCAMPTPVTNSPQWTTTPNNIFTKFEKSKFNNKTKDPLKEQNDLQRLLPEDLYNALKNSAAKGSLLSFLCTLSEEIVTDLLKPKGFTENRIYWINQIIKALILITSGMAIGKTLAAPAVNFLLIKAFGLSKNKSSFLTISGVIAHDLWVNPITTAKVAVMSVSATTSLLTSVATHFGYQKLKNQVAMITEITERVGLTSG